jgi:integrase
MSDEELNRFLNTTYDTTWREYVKYAFSFMMYANGLRIQDFLRLEWNNFTQIENEYYIRYRVKKTNLSHTTKLNLYSLQSLIPFLKTLEGVNLDSYSLALTLKERASESLQEAEKEYNEVEVKGFREVFCEFEIVSNMFKIKEIVKEQSKLEMKKIELESKIKSLKSMIEGYYDTMTDSIFAEIQLLKEKKKGKLRVFPKLNESKPEELEKRTIVMTTQFNYHLKKMQKQLDIKVNLSTHQARHIFAQRLFESGENFHFVSLALGHSSLETTENYRLKLVTEKAKDVTNSFANTLHNR